ncbi:MAG TPA: monomethylamine:corrinoid methyltransferase [Anaerolineales bacterium]|nr:monomethylamine:corrinoid methyltransferase [Anaerolineales bacterium]
MSINYERVLQVLDKAHGGPVHLDKDFNLKIIPQSLARATQKYGLAKTCDTENPVNTDDDLADRFYQAGFDAAVEIGLMCKDTNRCITFTREEIEAALKEASREFWLGEGNQRVRYAHRAPEDPTPPVWTVPLSIAVTEDVFVPLVEGLARIPQVDALEGPSLETIHGRRLWSGSPYEHLAGRYQADLMREAIRRAGREGMPMDAVGSSTTHYGVLGGYGVPGGYRPKHDLVLILSIADFWTSFESLFKLTQVAVTGGEHISASSWVMLGGYSGGPEGTAIACIGCTLLLVAAYQGSRSGVPPFDLAYMGNCGRRAQWALGVCNQALARNTHIVVHSINNQVAGPGTKMLLYETLVGMTNMGASGVSHVTGTRSAGGRLTNYLSPLEHRFGGEVYKASAGMTREHANEIARRFIPKYEDQLREPPDGMSFTECYDVEQLKPIPEWQRMYDEVREEAIQAGLNLG